MEGSVRSSAAGYYDGSSDGRAHIQRIRHSCLSVSAEKAPTQMMERLVESCVADSPVGSWLFAELNGDLGAKFQNQAFKSDDWNEFAARFIRKFGIKHSVVEIVTRLHHMHQQPGQAIADYNDEFERLRVRALTVGVSDDAMALFYLGGLSDQLRHHLSYQLNDFSDKEARLPTLEWIQERARIADTYVRPTSMPTTHATMAMQPSRSNSAGSWNGRQPRRHQRVDQHLWDQRMKANQCGFCGSNDHWFRDCRKSQGNA